MGGRADAIARADGRVGAKERADGRVDAEARATGRAGAGKKGGHPTARAHAAPNACSNACPNARLNARLNAHAFRPLAPLMIIAALLLCGAALTAKALYIPAKAELAQILLERAFDQSLARGRPIKPWSWADTAPAARLRVPRLGVSEIVLDAGSGEAMAFGPAQVRDDRANAVTILSAHRDTHFAFIRDLAVGDEIVFEPIGRAPMRLRVIGFETVRWDQFSYTAADPNRARIALATCWPFGTHRPGPLRRVAWAEAIPQ